MPTRLATRTQAHSGKGEIKVIADNQQISQINLIPMHQVGHRPTALVHIALRLCQHHLFAIDLSLGQQRLAVLATPGPAFGLGHLLDDMKADVVACLFVFSAWIAQARNHLHGLLAPPYLHFCTAKGPPPKDRGRDTLRTLMWARLLFLFTLYPA